jgi:hypothetical protein
MATFLYRCPITGIKVQGSIAEDVTSERTRVSTK